MTFVIKSDACAWDMTTWRIVVNGKRIEYDDACRFSQRCAMDGETAPAEVDWTAHIKGMLRAQMARHHVSYKELVDKLAAIGIAETEANLRNKVSRGGFTASFFVQCLVAMGVHSLRLDEFRPD